MKQIRDRITALIVISLIGIFLDIIILILMTGLVMRTSDVVEDISVIEEQIVEKQPIEDITVSINSISCGNVNILPIEKEFEAALAEEETHFMTNLIPAEQEMTEIEYSKGWATTNVNVRAEPSANSAIIATYNFNDEIEYADSGNDGHWVEVKYKDGPGYINKNYISDTKCDSSQMNIPSHRDFKSYMGYKKLTDKSSQQYKLQRQYAYTGTYGIRQVEGRYCVAIGSHFKTKIGQYFDLILENGTTIPCVMGDLKANQDTDSSNIFTHNGCCSEFIVDSTSLHPEAKKQGSISYACDEWNSQVVAIKVYNENVLV